MVGYMIGQKLSRRKPSDWMEKDHPRDVLMAATGMIATLVALVLGLLVSSAKSTFDNASDIVSEAGAKYIELDRSIRRIGPEADPVREQLQQFVIKAIEHIERGAQRTNINDLPDGPARPATIDEALSKPLRLLQTPTDEQKEQKNRALAIMGAIAETRWQLIERATNPLPLQFLVLLYFWLTVLFVGFGLLAPRDYTFFLSFAICGLSMAGAVYLILEMNNPLDGNLRISPAPLHIALKYIKA